MEVEKVILNTLYVLYMAVLTPPFGMKHSCRSVAPEKKMDERPVRELQFHICYNLAIYDAQKLAFT